MKIAAIFRPILLTGSLLLLVGCTRDELKVSQVGRVPVSTNITVVDSADSQVDTAGELKAVAAAPPAGPADTVPTPDRSQWRPRMPMVLAGSCPGESCTYGYLVTACEDIALVTTDSSGAKPTGIIVHKGDTVTLVTGNLHLLEPGIAVMKRDHAITDIVDDDYKAPRPDTLRFFAGDTVYVLDYLELGSWNWWYRGKPGSGNEFWTGVLQRSHSRDDDQKPAASISRPRGEWWYKLQVDTGNEGGWVRAARGWWVDLKFVSIDSDWKCGGPPGKSDVSLAQ
jgi:hypothetical protein